jgi:hypothetical protein
MIKPTPGRVVWYRPSVEDYASMTTFHGVPSQPFAAIVAYVWNDRLVNLTVSDQGGRTHARTSVPLVQEGDPAFAGGRYCEWMPYQVGQAKKHDAETKAS